MEVTNRPIIGAEVGGTWLQPRHRLRGEHWAEWHGVCDLGYSLTGLAVCFRDDPSSISVDSFELSQNATDQHPLGTGELNQANYRWVTLLGSMGELPSGT